MHANDKFICLLTNIKRNLKNSVFTAFSFFLALTFSLYSLLAAFISPLNSVWTFLAAIGAVIVPLIIRRKQKDQKENEQKKDDG